MASSKSVLWDKNFLRTCIVLQQKAPWTNLCSLRSHLLNQKVCDVVLICESQSFSIQIRIYLTQAFQKKNKARRIYVGPDSSGNINNGLLKLGDMRNHLNTDAFC